jgi:hypothetical protein
VAALVDVEGLDKSELEQADANKDKDEADTQPAQV